MTQGKLFPLALLHIGGASIEGATRFQKLVFLAQEETDLDSIFGFRPDKYGPFSPELAQTLEVLENEGYIERDVEQTRAGHERFNYRLTQKGVKAARGMAKDNQYKPLYENGKEVKKAHNEKPLDTLLKYVYRKYPDMTTETELDLEELYSDNSSRHPRSPPPS